MVAIPKPDIDSDIASASRIFECCRQWSGIASRLSIVSLIIFYTKQVGEGTGLGLSICFGIISEPKGDLAEILQPTSYLLFALPSKNCCLPSNPPASSIFEYPPIH